MGLGFAVQLRAASEPAYDPADLGRRIGEYLPVRGKSDVELCDELRLVQAFESMLAGYKTELVLALAARRPPQPGEATGGRWGAGEMCLPETSEFFPDELAQVLRCSRTAATDLAETSAVLHTRLAATSGGLADRLLGRTGGGTGRGPGRSPPSWVGRPVRCPMRWWVWWRPRCCPGPWS